MTKISFDITGKRMEYNPLPSSIMSSSGGLSLLKSMVGDWSTTMRDLREPETLVLAFAQYDIPNLMARIDMCTPGRMELYTCLNALSCLSTGTKHLYVGTEGVLQALQECLQDPVVLSLAADHLNIGPEIVTAV